MMCGRLMWLSWSGAAGRGNGRSRVPDTEHLESWGKARRKEESGQVGSDGAYHPKAATAVRSKHFGFCFEMGRL